MLRGVACFALVCLLLGAATTNAARPGKESVSKAKLTPALLSCNVRPQQHQQEAAGNVMGPAVSMPFDAQLNMHATLPRYFR